MKKPEPEVQQLVNEINMHEIMNEVRRLEIEDGEKKQSTKKKYGRKLNLDRLKQK